MNTIENISFLRPGWLLLLPVLLVLMVYLRRELQSGGWARYVAADKLRWLIDEPTTRATPWRRWVALATALLIVAAAGPSWQSLNSGTLHNRQAMVIAFDLSESMLAWDLKPTRLARARLKLVDLLRMRQDGDTALIAYAADAFRVAPLTNDGRTIEVLVPSLHPDVMPGAGSNTEAAITMAMQMLRDGGLPGGDIVLVTDGIAPEAIQWIEAQLAPGFRLSILATATTRAIDLKRSTGELIPAQVRDEDFTRLAALAERFGGRFTRITPDSTDIETIASVSARPILRAGRTGDDGFDSRLDGGWLFVLLALPVAALAFRRNALWLLILIMPVPETAYAGAWSDWWRTPNQQAAALLSAGRADLAVDRFTNPDWAAVAAYRSGNFTKAEQGFSKPGDSRNLRNLFNQANALVMQGKLAAAIKTYDRVLEQKPDHADATVNRELVQQTLDRIRSERELQKQRRQKSQSGESESEGTEEAKAEAAQQAQQIGGTSADGQSRGQQALQHQGASTQGEPRDADDANTPATPETLAEASETDQPKEPRLEGGGSNQTLNPYSEQWLRNLKPDPGALIRRKFEYQATQRNALSVTPVGPARH